MKIIKATLMSVGMLALSSVAVIAFAWTLRGSIPSNIVEAASFAFNMVLGTGKPLSATGDNALLQGESVMGTVNITNNSTSNGNDYRVRMTTSNVTAGTPCDNVDLKVVASYPGGTTTNQTYTVNEWKTPRELTDGVNKLKHGGGKMTVTQTASLTANATEGETCGWDEEFASGQ